MKRKCFHFEACGWRQLREETEVMREDRNMELSSRGMEGEWCGMMERVWGRKRKTEKGNEWWGSKEQMEKKGWKWKREDSRQNLLQWIELLADLCGVVVIIVHEPKEMGRREQCDAQAWACVYLCMHCSALLFSLSTLPMSPPKQTNFWIWQNPRLSWGNIHQHPHYTFPKSIYLALLVERRED